MTNFTISPETNFGLINRGHEMAAAQQLTDPACLPVGAVAITKAYADVEADACRTEAASAAAIDFEMQLAAVCKGGEAQAVIRGLARTAYFSSGQGKTVRTIPSAVSPGPKAKLGSIRNTVCARVDFTDQLQDAVTAPDENQAWLPVTKYVRQPSFLAAHPLAIGKILDAATQESSVARPHPVRDIVNQATEAIRKTLADVYDFKSWFLKQYFGDAQYDHEAIMDQWVTHLDYKWREVHSAAEADMDRQRIAALRAMPHAKAYATRPTAAEVARAKSSLAQHNRYGS